MIVVTTNDVPGYRVTAVLGEVMGLFDNMRTYPVTSKRKSSGQTGDAGTDNGYRFYGHKCADQK